MEIIRYKIQKKIETNKDKKKFWKTIKENKTSKKQRQKDMGINKVQRFI